MYLSLVKLACMLSFIYGLAANRIQDQSNSLSSQTSSLIELLDLDLNPIAAGKIVRINKLSIIISDGFGKNIEVERRKLSEQSKISIKNFDSEILAGEAKKKKLNQLMPKVAKGSKASQKNTLKKLMELGTFAGMATPSVSQIAKHNENDLGVTAFYTFLSICPKNKSSATLMKQILVRNRFLKQAIINSPEQYLICLTEFKDICEEDLIFTAFHGEVSLKNPSPEDLLKPKDLLTTHGKVNLIRSVAIHQLAKLESAKAQKSFFDVILTAEKRINGQIDQLTLYAAFRGCAQAGRKYTSAGKMMNFFNKYKNQFPDEAKLWQLNWQQNFTESRESARLQKSSKMRNFSNRRGDFLIRGEIEKIEQGVIVFLDHRLSRKTIRIDQLSSEDQKYLSQK